MLRKQKLEASNTMASSTLVSVGLGQVLQVTANTALPAIVLMGNILNALPPKIWLALERQKLTLFMSYCEEHCRDDNLN